MRLTARAALFAVLLLAGSAGAARADVGSLKGTHPGDLAFPDFTDADTCATCHGGGFAGDTTFLPSDTWAGTMMANAARDPVFFASLAIANQDSPGLGTYCLRCHSPTAFVSGHATPADGSAFDDIDRQGVGCETCHRATPSPGADAPYLLSDAQLVFTEDTTKRGPYADTTAQAHDSLPDASLSDARFCGQCHQVTNPEVHLKDTTGADTGLEFPLDTTYEEWEHSSFAQPGQRSCQDCHMPRKAGMHPTTRIPGSPLRQDPREHGFVGGNHWGIKAVMAANPARAALYPEPFARALQSTLDNLTSAVKVSLTSAPTTVSPGGAFQVKVKVENLTGHKFPTGYAESRRAWVGVSLVGADLNEQALVGGYDLATGQIQAIPATHVYRAEHGTWDGTKSVADGHLALHDVIVSDTRIPPAGFTATPTTTPTGEIDFTEGKGGYRSTDEITFDLRWPSDVSGDVTLSARVYYQAMTREHVDLLRAANTSDESGNQLAAIFEATGAGAPLLIARAEITLGEPMTTGASVGASGTGGASDTSAGATSSGVGGASGTGGGDAAGCGCSTRDARPSAWGSLVPLLVAAAARSGGRRRR